jgi:hypothetical protein
LRRRTASGACATCATCATLNRTTIVNLNIATQDTGASNAAGATIAARAASATNSA